VTMEAWTDGLATAAVLAVAAALLGAPCICDGALWFPLGGVAARTSLSEFVGGGVPGATGGDAAARDAFHE
jgi:hypothetical protein